MMLTLSSLVEPPDCLPPEYDLIAAVILRAWDDAHGIHLTATSGHTAEHRAKRRRMLKRAARRWFYSERKTAGSFLWCCDLLGLTPDAVRRSIHTVSHTQPQKFGPRVQSLQNIAADENPLDRPRQWA